LVGNRTNPPLVLISLVYHHISSWIISLRIPRLYRSVGNKIYKSESMSNTSEQEHNLSVCANCGNGKEASINLKSCAACKLVKYCSRDCQIAHRPQHRHECKKRAVELHDIELFKQPPPSEECPICFLQLPLISTARIYMTCCGKVICCGCTHAPVHDNEGNVIREKTCPFCRTPFAYSDEKTIKRFEKRMELNDPIAITTWGAIIVMEGLIYHQIIQRH